MFVGDTVWDVRASRKAGVPCIGLLSGGICREELADAGAAQIYAGPCDLLARLPDSPDRAPRPSGRISDASTRPSGWSLIAPSADGRSRGCSAQQSECHVPPRWRTRRASGRSPERLDQLLGRTRPDRRALRAVTPSPVVVAVCRPTEAGPSPRIRKPFLVF